MDNIKPVCVDEDIVSLLKEIADESKATISSVANYYLRIATRDLERPKEADLIKRKKRGRKRSEDATQQVQVVETTEDQEALDAYLG